MVGYGERTYDSADGDGETFVRYHHISVPSPHVSTSGLPILAVEPGFLYGRMILKGSFERCVYIFTPLAKSTGTRTRVH